ncbi:cupin domain-containing protein [Variovorax sp. YR752]|uniref:cupin domain-containing protein n=1 Tax=Variovorax sp. YR752 TaxID=1884383 RepID=UPI0031382A87
MEPDHDPSDLATPKQARAMRLRLLERVADAEDSHLTIGPGDGEWQAFSEGVAIKVLREQDGVLSYLLRLEAGARLPAHRHPVDEECVVLQGSLRVGSRIEVGPGGYHLAHRGALHAGISTVAGATLFLRGAVPDASQIVS